jgi:3-oxoacyl-[acyl-carrier-protein] synthase III
LKRTHTAKHCPKVVPDFWWDFSDGATAIIVESSDDRFPVITRFPLVEGANAEPMIEKATALIEDLRAGRITQKQAMHQ